MRFLLISLCFLVLSCGSYPKKQAFVSQENTVREIENLYFSNPELDYVYKANIDVYDNHFGGVFIVKKLGDNNHRIVFTTEMGAKLFDFSFINNDFKVNYIVDKLDKKILINILKKDFQVLVKQHLEVVNTFSNSNEAIFETSLNNQKHYYFKNDNLTKVVKANNGKERITFHFSKINDNIAKHIQILHSNIKLKINLKSIN